MSWIEEEARLADPRKNRVILENPVAVKELDDVLMGRYYPPIKRALRETGYPFSSVDDGRLPLESRSSPFGLGRCLTFTLFDDFGRLILRGKVTRSFEGFLFDREFFLGLPRSTEPSFLFRIIADEAFAGMIPPLTVHPSEIDPEWNTYYSITLEKGAGIEGRQWALDQAAIGNIEETITTSVEMYESTIDGFETMADVEAFIALARRCFETS